MSSGREHTEIGIIGVIASAIISLLFGDIRALLLPGGKMDISKKLAINKKLLKK